MKRIWDLNDEEVLSLTDEQVARFVDIECAHEGAPIEPDYPGPKPEVEDPECDQVLYNVTGVPYYFDDKAVADALAAAFTGARMFDTKKIGTIEVVRDIPSYHSPQDFGTVSTKAVVSMQSYDKHREAIEANAALIRKWESAKSEYDSAIRERRKAADSVYEYVAEARKRDMRRKQLEKALAEYVALADGDETIALRFLHSAYPDAADFEQFGPVPEPEEGEDADNE